MGLRFLIIASFIAGLIASISAHAATVDLTGKNYEFADTVVGGQTGSITTKAIKIDDGNKQYAYASGFLAPFTQIVFTFTTKKDSGYAYIHSTVPYLTETVTARGHDGFPSVTSSNSLITVTASCVYDCEATSTLVNRSDMAVEFYTFLLDKNGNKATATYIASSIPLPPAALLFATGLAALLASRKRKIGAV